jgi:hypothetical protein
MQRLASAVLAAALAALAAPAQAACLALGMDERLAARCLTDMFLTTGPRGKAITGPVVERLLTRQGLAGPPGAGNTVQPFVQPLLSWSDNVNGGNRRGTLFGPFEALPPYAEQGVLAGLRAGLQGRDVYRPGGFIDFSLSASYEYAPRHEIGVTRAFGRLCSSNSLQLSWTADACLTGSAVDRKEDSSSAIEADLTLARLFGSLPGVHHRAYGGVRQLQTTDYRQIQYVAGLETASVRWPFLAIEATMGEPVGDQTVLLHAASATLSDQLLGRPFALTLSYRYSGGERILVFDRFDRELQAVASYNIWGGYYVQLGYRDVDSTLDYFDESEPVFGLSLATIRF